MKHARQKIREQVETTLAGITTATIYRSRVFQTDQLPAIFIYGNDEESESETEYLSNNKRYSRQMDLTIEVQAEALADVDDLVDDLAAQVEALIGADSTLNSKAVDCNLIATNLELDRSGDMPLAVCSLLYQVWYRTTAADAETSITS